MDERVNKELDTWWVKFEEAERLKEGLQSLMDQLLEAEKDPKNMEPKPSNELKRSYAIICDRSKKLWHSLDELHTLSRDAYYKKLSAEGLKRVAEAQDRVDEEQSQVQKMMKDFHYDHVAFIGI